MAELIGYDLNRGDSTDAVHPFEDLSFDGTIVRIIAPTKTICRPACLERWHEAGDGIYEQA